MESRGNGGAEGRREKSASVVASLASYWQMSVGDGGGGEGEGEGGSTVRDHKDAAGAQGQRRRRRLGR